MNCDQGTLNNTGFVYTHTFAQAGSFSYFCFARSRHDWRGQRRSRPNSDAYSNTNGHSHCYSHTFGNPNSNTDSNR
jgi:hypothetical protein